MEEEEHHHSINNNSRRLQIRRNNLRQINTSRSSPYDSSLSNIQRQRQRQTSESISNLITNLENPVETDIASIEQEQIENINGNSTDDYEVIFEFDETSLVDEIHPEQDESYQSSSTTFDSDLNDDENHSRYYYTSTSIPIYEYSSTNEPLTHPIDLSNHQVYSPLIDTDDDLSIEVILESSLDNSLPPISRRRRSILPSNNRTNRGLRSSDISNIPQKLYSSLKEHFDDTIYSSIITNTQCYICLEDFQSIDSIKILNCQHIFHSECINEWLRNHSNCAYCRTPVLIDLLRRQRTRTRRQYNSIARTSTNDSIQQISSESPIVEQE